MAFISCKNLQLGYNGVPVACPITFSVEKGDYLCIVGENGSGKSTLVKTLLKLEKPLSGEIEFGDGLTAREIGYLPQQNEIQKDFPASVWEIVISGTLSKCHLKPFYTKRERELAEQALKKMEISHLKNECYRNLSGGQQQRVLLARCLCATEKLILLDEPVTGLDPKATGEMYHLIDELNKSGITVIMISHDLEEAVKYASHILQIEKDRFIFTTSEVYINHNMGCHEEGDACCEVCHGHDS